MKALVLHKPNDYRVEEVDSPDAGEELVQIRVHLAGICGTDLHVLRGHNPFVSYPLVPGHEYVGEVLSAPADSGLKPGVRVTVFPGKGCGVCQACKAGRIPHCPDFKFIGTSLAGGCFAETVVADPERVFVVPPEIDDRVAAMIEPVAVAVHANRRAGILRSKSSSGVVVIGGGTIGILIAAVAQSCGASPLVLSEPIEFRRGLARRMGIRNVHDPSSGDLVDFVRSKMPEADVVFDAVGSETTLLAAQEVLGAGKLLMLVAAPSRPNMSVPYEALFKKELSAVGTRTYFLEDFVEAIEILRSGNLKAAPLISDVIPFPRFQQAIHLLETEPERYVKILIDMTSR